MLVFDTLSAAYRAGFELYDRASARTDHHIVRRSVTGRDGIRRFQLALVKREEVTDYA